MKLKLKIAYKVNTEAGDRQYLAQDMNNLDDVLGQWYIVLFYKDQILIEKAYR